MGSTRCELSVVPDLQGVGHGADADHHLGSHRHQPAQTGLEVDHLPDQPGPSTDHPPQHPPSHSHPLVSWAVETISINIALFVTLLYWSAVHGYVLQYKLLEDEADWMFNIFNHSFNTLLSILDLVISARPVSLYHAYLPVMYGLLYSLFSLLYWLLGGEGICVAVQCDQQTECPLQCLQCAPIIYPLLDWGEAPLLALLTTGGGCVGVLVFTSFYYGIYRARLFSHRTLCTRDVSVQDSHTTYRL